MFHLAPYIGSSCVLKCSFFSLLGRTPSSCEDMDCVRGYKTLEPLSSALLHASCAIERLKEALYTREGVGARQAEWDAEKAIGLLNEICNENPRFAAKQAEWEESIEVQKEDQRPLTKRPRVGDVGQEWAACGQGLQPRPLRSCQRRRLRRRRNRS